MALSSQFQKEQLPKCTRNKYNNKFRAPTGSLGCGKDGEIL